MNNIHVLIAFAVLCILAVTVACCGGRLLVVSCPDQQVGCVPPGSTDANKAYCCPPQYQCCRRWGTTNGCCSGEVPDAEIF